MNIYLNLVNVNLVLGVKKLNPRLNSIKNLDLAKKSDPIIFSDFANFA